MRLIASVTFGSEFRILRSYPIEFQSEGILGNGFDDGIGSPQAYLPGLRANLNVRSISQRVLNNCLAIHPNFAILVGQAEQIHKTSQIFGAEALLQPTTLGSDAANAAPRL